MFQSPLPATTNPLVTATQPNISETEAWEIAKSFAHEAATLLGANFVAAVVVGSLSAGSYTPGRSDIDLMVIACDSCDDATLKTVSRIAARYWEETGLRKGFGGYAIRERDLKPPIGVLRDEVYEILQLKRQGRVILGELNLSDIPEPSKNDMHRSLVAFIPDLLGGWDRSYPPPIDARDARVNNILYWLRILIWDRKGEYLLSKESALAAAQALPDCREILKRLEPVAAYINREQVRPPDDIAEICHEVEDFVLSKVEWAREAAQDETTG